MFILMLPTIMTILVIFTFTFCITGSLLATVVQIASVALIVLLLCAIVIIYTTSGLDELVD